MNKEIADLWADALESGKYEQTREMLRHGGGYCCLGVLCDISGQGAWDGDFYVAGDGASHTRPPYLVTQWAGMNSDYPEGKLKEWKRSDDWAGVDTFLTGLNDHLKYDFKQIASVIREHWQEL
jgi:hypothetical protein